MSETRSMMRAHRIDYICDRCHEGSMIAANLVYTSNPPQYPHQCDVCGWTATFPKTYPHVEFHQEAAQ